jgi:hypothetical protein
VESPVNADQQPSTLSALGQRPAPSLVPLHPPGNDKANEGPGRRTRPLTVGIE